MTTTIEGDLATVEVGEVKGGYAWRCQTCSGTAGLPLHGEPAAPFTDIEWRGEQLTAEQFATLSATNHANLVCAGQTAGRGPSPFQ